SASSAAARSTPPGGARSTPTPTGSTQPDRAPGPARAGLLPGPAVARAAGARKVRTAVDHRQHGGSGPDRAGRAAGDGAEPPGAGSAAPRDPALVPRACPRPAVAPGGGVCLGRAGQRGDAAADPGGPGGAALAGVD